MDYTYTCKSIWSLAGFQPTAVIPNYRTIELRLLGRDSCRSITSVSSTEETCLSRSGTVMSGMATPPRPALSRANTYDTETNAHSSCPLVTRLLYSVLRQL